LPELPLEQALSRFFLIRELDVVALWAGRESDGIDTAISMHGVAMSA
jgi:hypothetical protein